MDGFMYHDILQSTMLPYAEEEMRMLWRYQQDNDPKHSSHLIKNGFLEKAMIYWNDHRKIRQRIIHSENDLWGVLQDEWWKAPVDVCRNLVDSMRRRFREVTKVKGCSTKY
ncbi:unnamed protein product [Acanthoscelides obtectus]|uniref:Uncharacterized protein n=1 Tax=Acanthoscelides obtectus TaxID=200917 RepID=A0A9P0PAF1_ACAOB|nr:unnamed protein product [Acanthoscelides obtectus]CAK1642634.1 hypothetical protein AOBTE_LOCUS13147 [Acanthoscelides obtectus]